MKKRYIPAALLLLLCAILLFACEKTESPAVSAVEPSADALDPCVLIDFTGKQAQTLLTAAQIGSDDYSFTKNGLLISGKQKSVRDGVYTIAGTFDFGSVQSDAPVCRMMIDSLSKIGTNVSIKLYLDGQDTPFIEKQLNMQSQKKVWDERNPVFCELSEPIWGVHTIRFTVEDVSSGRDEKTAALIRGFRFYRQSGLPTVYVNIDESLNSIEAMNTDPKHETRCYGSITVDNGSTLFEDTVFTAKWVSAEDVILPEAIYLERSETYLRVDKSIV